MKRTFAKQSLMSLVAGFFLFGMLLTASSAAAQTNWKQPAEAQQAIVAEMNTLRNAMSVNPPGSAAYNDAAISAYYYKAVYTKIEDGESVGNAVKTSLDIFPSSNPNGTATGMKYPEITVDVDKARKNALLNAATTLLSQ